jgi:hypothetical protein
MRIPNDIGPHHTAAALDAVLSKTAGDLTVADVEFLGGALTHLPTPSPTAPLWEVFGGVAPEAAEDSEPAARKKAHKGAPKT